MTLWIHTDLQELNMRNLLKTNAFQFADEKKPWFPYTSGQIGPYYVQSTAIEKDGALYATAVNSMVEIIQSEFKTFDAVSGGETRDWDFSNPVAVAMQKPHIKIYKNGQTLGADISNKKILHVADLNNEGSSVKDYWKPTIEKHGGRLTGVISFVDRMEDGFTLLKDLGLVVISVVPLNEHAWHLALQEGYVSQSVYSALVKRMNDRHGWAIRSLLNHPNHFRALFRDPTTKSKAVKIMETYPEIKKELNQMIKE